MPLFTKKEEETENVEAQQICNHNKITQPLKGFCQSQNMRILALSDTIWLFWMNWKEITCMYFDSCLFVICCWKISYLLEKVLHFHEILCWKRIDFKLKLPLDNALSWRVPGIFGKFTVRHSWKRYRTFLWSIWKSEEYFHQERQIRVLCKSKVIPKERIVDH